MDPDIRYARSEGASIAYQIVGDGERDLVFVPDFSSNLVYGWERRTGARFTSGSPRSFRLILFDKRGTGVSDRHGQFATLETRMEDLRAVLDATDAPGPSSWPRTTDATWPCSSPPPTPSGRPRSRSSSAGTAQEPDDWGDQFLRRVRFEWGTQEFCDELLEVVCPTLFNRGPEARLWFANEMRVGLSPEFSYALNRAFSETDMRPVLPAIKAPTLVFYREGSVEAEQHREVAARIEGAHEVRLSGSDYWGIFLSPEIVDEIEQFVGGRPMAEVPDSVLATVLFTDIVGSTERAAELGDRGWREVLERHHALVRRELTRFRGEEKDTAGDGFFATFDGPARAIRCAQSVAEQVRDLGLELRAGLHTGECELHDDKVAGIAVSIGARVAGLAQPGEVLVSSTVKDLVAGSGIDFRDRGEHELKGVPGAWKLYAVT